MYSLNGALIKYGEISIRGKNRSLYEKMLIRQLERVLGLDYRITKEQGRFFVESKSAVFDFEYVIARSRKVMGIHSVCPCAKLNTMDLEEIQNAALSHVQMFHSGRKQSFKVKTRRADKRYPYASLETSAQVGGYILENMPELSVDVVNPDFTVYIELRTGVYIYSKEFKGASGLPVSSSGKAAYLLSGGIDSPVAAYLMAKRGVYGEFVYFHSPPYVGERAKQKVMDLAQKVAEYTGPAKLHIIPFTDVQLYLKEQVPEDKLTVFLKRQMLAVSEKLAEQERMQALVVGDSVGQVASQTLTAIHAVDSAVSMPILRPLAGFNKEDTIRLAKEIGTYEISIRPYEDCCTLFVAKHPELKPKRSVIERIEAKQERLAELNEAAFCSREIIPLL